ncbi:phage tail tape measure protein [Paenibacillus lautus]|uniref:phage tail tape measure protein n=1 Tax=Paenibacillus lautus TaxID=1401 RepID=UPI003D29D3A1
MRLLNNHVDDFKKSSLASFSSAAKSAAGAALAIGGISLAAAGISGSVDFIKEYGSSLDNLRAATGATASEMASMKDQLTDLYNSNVGEGWADLADSMTIAKQVTKQTGEELKKTTAFAVGYRDVFGEDVTQSVKAADTMMKNFGITSEQSFNLLAQGAQNGLNKSDELIDSANEYSVYFKNLGYSANEMFDIFGTGLENGAFNLFIGALWWRRHTETSLIHGTPNVKSRVIMSEAC